MDLEEIKNNPTRYIKSLAMDLIVALVGIAYVLYQMVTLEPTDLNPLVLLSQAFIGIICGVTIKQALGENGFSKAYNSEEWNSELEKYNDSCNAAISYMERADNYYISEEIDKRRNYRIEHLQAKRMKYDQWFDFEGNYIGSPEKFKQLSFRQKLELKRCIRIKIYIPNLFSEYSTVSDKYTHREMTDKKVRAKNITKNSITATLIAVIGVYFIPVINNWNWASLISSTMQVALWIMFGIIQLYNNYSYVVRDKVDMLKEKKKDISKFVSNCEKGMYIENPYLNLIANKPTPLYNNNSDNN